MFQKKKKNIAQQFPKYFENLTVYSFPKIIDVCGVGCNTVDFVLKIIKK